jgi:hypothetical protein
MDYGVYEKSNIPIVKETLKLYSLYNTEVNFTDFCQFVSVDVNDVVRNAKKDKLKVLARD